MDETQATLTLIGGPTLLIELGGVRVLTDPTFDPPGDYASGTLTLHKSAGPALTANQVGAVDAVLLSHDQHADNLDPSGRVFLGRADVTLSTPIAASRLGGNGKGLVPWQTTELTGSDGSRLHVTATPARHGPVGIEPIAGDVTGFLLGVGEPGDAIYVTGDTVWFEGVAEVARRYRPAIVVLFAGSAKTRGAFHLTMDSNDAIEAAHAFPQAQIVAIHTDGWAHFSENGTELQNAFKALGLGERLHSLVPGEATPLRLGRR